MDNEKENKISEEQDEKQRQITPEEARKFLNKLRNTEIRQALLGNFIRRSDGKYVAGASDIFATNGFGDGAQEVLALGITKRVYHYRTTLGNTQAIFRMTKVFKDFGRAFVLESVPNATGCYVRSYIFRPVLLVFEENREKQLTLTAYCGRSPLAFIPIRYAVSRLNKVLPKQVFPEFQKK